jgi:hypothetical protein
MLAAIGAEIEQNIGFLSTNLRNVPERHRSVNAIFAQTWQMLSDAERVIFKRLALFRGGFRRGAAEAVAGATLPVLSALVNKSLLRWESNGRYQLHGLLRQFAQERLVEDPDEAANLLDTHAAYFADSLHRRRDEIVGVRQHEVLREIGAELEDIRSAWAHAVHRRRLDWLGQAPYTLYQFFDMQGRSTMFIAWNCPTALPPTPRSGWRCWPPCKATMRRPLHWPLPAIGVTAGVTTATICSRMGPANFSPRSPGRCPPPN